MAHGLLSGKEAPNRGGSRFVKLRYGKIVDVLERFYAFEDIYRVETGSLDKKRKGRWMGAYCSRSVCVDLYLLKKRDREVDLDLEYRDLLAALYKLCPRLRQVPGDSEVGDAAGRQLSDQAQLAKIAVDDKDALVRATAVRKLTDPTLLGKVVLRDKDTLVRAAAVENLTDQTLLATIAIDDKHAVVRAAAVKQLADQTVLVTIAVEDKDALVRAAAVKQLTDQKVLAKIAVKDWDPVVREEAVGKLTDPTLLAKIAVKDMDAVVRAAAAKQLTFQKETGQSQGQTENQVQEK